jgi:hypothetical protein
MTSALTATPDGRFGTDVIPVGSSGGAPITTIPAVRVERTAADYLIRRLNFVLFDLGLVRILPKGWASPTADGIAFEKLSLKQAEVVISILEDVISGRNPASRTPGVGQLQFFDSTQR